MVPGVAERQQDSDAAELELDESDEGCGRVEAWARRMRRRTRVLVASEPDLPSLV